MAMGATTFSWGIRSISYVDGDNGLSHWIQNRLGRPGMDWRNGAAKIVR